jgi:hypothetical protein
MFARLVPPAVEVMVPNELPAGLLVLGLEKFGWLGTLKASSRVSSFRRSPRIGQMREICASNWKNMGPLTRFLCRLPKVPRGTVGEQEAWLKQKAAGFRYP